VLIPTESAPRAGGDTHSCSAGSVCGESSGTDDLLSISICFSAPFRTARQCWIRKFPRSYFVRLSSSPTWPDSISERICRSSRSASSKDWGGPCAFFAMRLSIPAGASERLSARRRPSSLPHGLILVAFTGAGAEIDHRSADAGDEQPDDAPTSQA